MQAQSAVGHVGALSPPRAPSWRRKESKSVTPPGQARVVERAEAAFEWNAPFVLFCLYTFVLVGRPQDHMPFLVPLRPALLLTFVSACMLLLRPMPEDLKAIRSLPETKYYFGLFAAMVWTIPFATFRPSAFDFVVMQYVVNVMYFVLFAMTVNTLERFKRVAAVLLLSGLLFTIMGLTKGQFIQGRYTVGSEMYDPNDVAFVEIALMGFAMWMLVASSSVVMKVAAGVSVVLGALLTLYTGSRGGLLSLGAFLLMFMGLRIKGFGGGFKMLVIVGILVAGFLNSDKINIERYMTLGSLETDYNFEEWGRADIWERGFNLFLADPLTGVGVTNFGAAIGEMRRVEGLIPKWQAPHSAYLEILTETGFFGALSFLLLVGATLHTFHRVRRLEVRSPFDRELASLGGMLFAGFVAQLVAASFLTQAYSMFFTLAFSASAAVRRIADAPRAGAAASAQPPAPVQFVPKSRKA